METTLNLTTFDQESLTESIIKIDNSGNFKDFGINQKFVIFKGQNTPIDDSETELHISIGVDEISIGGVKFTGIALKLFLEFINQRV